MKRDSWVWTGTCPSHPGSVQLPEHHLSRHRSQWYGELSTLPFISDIYTEWSLCAHVKTLYKTRNPQVSYKTHLCRICFSTLTPSGFCAVISSTGNLWAINTKKKNNLKYLSIPVPTVGVSVAGEGKRRRLCRRHVRTLPALPGRPRTSISRCEPRGFREARGPPDFTATLLAPAAAQHECPRGTGITSQSSG